MKSDLGKFVRILEEFTGPKLTATLSDVEASICGLTAGACHAFLKNAKVDRQVLAAAAGLKQVAGQINVVIHAIGILRCLPHILEDGETVEYVSLGAGNTGRLFDLETNKRIAEFKFIHWRGGSESIRQNSIFKDVFNLARHNSDKQKILYTLDTHFPKKFFQSARSIDSVLSRHAKLRVLFQEIHGDKFEQVRDWYDAHGRVVSLVDVSPWLSELT
jgi:hypothetical protein